MDSLRRLQEALRKRIDSAKQTVSRSVSDDKEIFQRGNIAVPQRVTNTVNNIFDDKGIVQRGRIAPLKYSQDKLVESTKPLVDRAKYNFKGNISNIKNYGWQNIKTAANPATADQFNQRLNRPGTTAPDTQKYLINRYGAPLLQTPYRFRQLEEGVGGLLNKPSWEAAGNVGMGALGTVGGIMTLGVDPIQDVGMPLVDALKGYSAKRIRGGNLKESLKAGKEGLTLENPVGVGTALTTDPNAAMIGDIAELPLAIGLTHKMNKQFQGGWSKEQLETVRRGFDPEVRKLVGQFSEIVEKSPATANKKNLGELGDYIQSLAETVFGKEAETMTNKQLKNAFDNIMQVADRYGGGIKEPFSIGLNARNIRDDLENTKLPMSKEEARAKLPDILYESQAERIKKNPQFKNLSSQPNSVKSTEEYIQELKQSRQNIKDGEKPGVVQKVKTFLADVKEKMVDSISPIDDAITEAEKQGKFKILPKDDFRLQADRVLRSKTLASQYAEDNGFTKVIQEAPDLDALDQYLIAKQAQDVAEFGIETGRNRKQDAQLIKDLAPVYEPYAKQVNEYSRKLLDYSVETGLIDKKLADELKNKYPHYVPLQRVFSEMEKSQLPKGVGTRPIASLSRQSVVQKLKGSERDIESPIESLLLKTQDAINQGERNKAAKMLAQMSKLPDNPLGIIPLRIRENVLRRIDIFKEANELGIEKRKIDLLINTKNQWARKLQSELNKLNKQGIEAYLKRPDTQEELIQPFVSSIKQKQYFNRPNIETDTGDVFKGPATLTGQKFEDQYVQLNARQVRELINNLINESPDKIDAIKKKIALRDKKLAKTIEVIEDLQSKSDVLKSKRKELFDEARLIRDAESRGKGTISYLNNGITEVYEVPKEMETAAKSLNQEQLGLLGKIASMSTRILQMGATGLNVPFVVSNVLKDEITGFINSNRAAKTSLINPINYGRALFSALKHDDLYKEVTRNAAGGTSFDISRQAPDLSVKRIRAGRSITSNTLYTVTHPGELLRALEDTIGRSEEFGRIKNYGGYKEAMLKEGRTIQDAQLLAAKAARENTANFARRGSWGRVLNYAIPYLNAGIQGGRQLTRSFQNAPLETTGKIVATLYMPVTAATAWNLADDKRREVYEDISDYEKENNIIFIPPEPTKDAQGRWNVIKIPIPPGLSNLTSLVRRPIEASAGLDPVKFSEIATNIISAGTGVDVTSPTKLLSSTTPQLTKVPLEFTLNKNLFTGEDVVPDFMSDRPPEGQVYDTTSGTARIIGKATNQSPLKIENAARTAFGGVGSQLLNTSDTVLNKMGKIPDEQVGGESILGNIERRFSKAYGGQTDRDIKDLVIGNKGNEDYIAYQVKNGKFDAIDPKTPRNSADAVWRYLSDVPKKDRQVEYDKIKSYLTPEIKEELKTIVEMESKGLTRKDRDLMIIPVEKRARPVWDRLMDLSEKNRQEKYDQLKKEGIITPDMIPLLQKMQKEAK